MNAPNRLFKGDRKLTQTGAELDLTDDKETSPDHFKTTNDANTVSAAGGDAYHDKSIDESSDQCKMSHLNSSIY